MNSPETGIGNDKMMKLDIGGGGGFNPGNESPLWVNKSTCLIR